MTTQESLPATGTDSRLAAARELLRRRVRAALDDSAAGPAAATAPAPSADGPAAEPVASFAQERMWLVDRMMDGTPGYAIPEVVRLRGPVRPDLLRRSLTAVVARHAPLRTVFEERDGAPHPVVLPAPEAVPLPVLDLGSAPSPNWRSGPTPWPARRSADPSTSRRARCCAPC